MTLMEQQIAFTHDVALLLHNLFCINQRVTLGEAYRTPEQAAIYAKEGKGIVDSLHCKRLAIDLNLFDESGKLLSDVDSYRHAGDVWKSLNCLNVWGGDWKATPEHPHQVSDSDHFERKLL